MYSFYLNIVLIIIAFLLLGTLLFVKLYFTRLYQQSSSPEINSSNNVISNKEISEIAETMKNFYGLSDWTINYGNIKYTNFGRGVNRSKRIINIARLPFASVGYEIDYLLSRIWYVKATREKQKGVKLFSFLSNYLMVILPIVGFILLVLQLIIFIYGTAYSKGASIPNEGMKFLYEYPVVFIILFMTLASMAVVFMSLQPIKENLEIIFSGDTYAYFAKQFPNFAYDLKSARTYSNDIKIAYNFSFKRKDEQRLMHWIGPFLNY